MKREPSGRPWQRSPTLLFTYYYALIYLNPFSSFYSFYQGLLTAVPHLSFFFIYFSNEVFLLVDIYFFNPFHFHCLLNDIWVIIPSWISFANIHVLISQADYVSISVAHLRVTPPNFYLTAESVETLLSLTLYYVSCIQSLSEAKSNLRLMVIIPNFPEKVSNGKR